MSSGSKTVELKEKLVELLNRVVDFESIEEAIIYKSLLLTELNSIPNNGI